MQKNKIFSKKFSKTYCKNEKNKLLYSMYVAMWVTAARNTYKKVVKQLI